MLNKYAYLSVSPVACVNAVSHQTSIFCTKISITYQVLKLQLRLLNFDEIFVYAILLSFTLFISPISFTIICFYLTFGNDFYTLNTNISRQK